MKFGISDRSSHQQLISNVVLGYLLLQSFLSAFGNQETVYGKTDYLLETSSQSILNEYDVQSMSKFNFRFHCYTNKALLFNGSCHSSPDCNSIHHIILRALVFQFTNRGVLQAVIYLLSMSFIPLIICTRGKSFTHFSIFDWYNLIRINRAAERIC